MWELNQRHVVQQLVSATAALFIHELNSRSQQQAIKNSGPFTVIIL